jgi:surface antigen
MVAMRVRPPKRKKRHWASGAVILTLVAATALTAIATVTPLASGHAEGLAVHAAGPLGLPVALDAANRPPSGDWVALIGLQPNQDVGGGAGPGVKAPGSAGLPVTSVQTVVNTGAPSAQQAGAVSPPPLSPWPPAWAFSAVPGYSSFGMNDVGGYYNWAFGQCTWWAQYERKDENLMHMGNAQFWAGGAASRGYKVGWQPQVGATVVFQPGVQGAGGAGHVAHVVKVYPDNWFLVSEMNFYWNGGGWGRIDYRFAHAGSGVQFIY